MTPILLNRPQIELVLKVRKAGKVKHSELSGTETIRAQELCNLRRIKKIKDAAGDYYIEHPDLAPAPQATVV